MQKRESGFADYLTLIASWLLLLGLLISYWVQAQATAQQQTRLAEDLARKGSEQTSHALALQTQTLLRTLDYVSVQLIDQWLREGDRGLRAAASRSRKTLQDGALLNVAVTDADGRVIFSELDSPRSTLGSPVSFADREHFQAHFHTPLPPARLFISEPTLGRITQKWAILLTRPIEQQGQRVGVLLLSVSAAHLSQALKQVYSDPQDAALIVRSDGKYLARSHQINKVLGTAVPPDRPFIRHPEQEHGLYHVKAPVDGVERYYAWHRLSEYPLIVSVGISRAKALAPVTLAQQETFRRNVIGSIVVVVMMLFVSRLLLKASRQERALRIAHERLTVTLHSAHDGVWSWQANNERVEWDEGLHKMLALPTHAAPRNPHDWTDLVHPQDLPKLTREWLAYLREANDGVFATEIRMQTGNGSSLWVSMRARVVERDATGRPQLVVGTYTDISDRIRAVQLRHVLLEQSSAAIVMANWRREIIFANERFIEVFGPIAPGAPNSLHNFHVDAAHAERVMAQYQVLRQDGRCRFEYPLKDQHGQTRWFNIQGVLNDFTDPDGDVVWTLFDITDRHLAHEQLIVERKRLDVLLERFPGGVLMEDASHRVVLLNRLVVEWLGLNDQDGSLIGVTHEQLCEHLDPSCAAWLDDAHPQERRESGTTLEVERPDGRVLEVKRIEINENDEPLGRVWLLQDITARKHKERDLTALAATDSLTGLPNRRAFMAALEHALDVTHHPAGPTCAVLILDIDFFKQVNDSHGHPIGDVVLQEVANRVRTCLRQRDTAGRLGGEEFAVVLEAISPDDAIRKADGIRERIAAEPFATAAGLLHVTMSIGIAFPGSGLGAAEVLSNADQALYQAKQEGRNRVVAWQAAG